MTVEKIASEPKFRPCQGCGNLIPASRADCEYCGFRPAEAAVAEQEAEKERHFFYALVNRSNPFTMIFIGVNVGVFLLMWMAGGMSAIGTDDEVLIGFGAKVNQLIDERHQYWRFITSVFIHIGFLHIFFNMYALWIIGQEIERLYGSSRFVIIYLLCGIAGSYASYQFNPGAVSAGASGAIFGLFGVMATFAFRYRRELPSGLASEIKRRILPVIIINLAIGFSIRVVDNAAHVGGLLTGAALCFLIPYKRPHEKATASVWRAFLVVCLLVISASFVLAFINYDGPRPRLANFSARPQTNVIDYFEGMEEANRSLRSSINSFAAVLEGNNDKNVPAIINSIEGGIKSVDRSPTVDEESGRFRERLLGLLTEYDAVVESYAKGNQKDRRKVANDHNALTKKYNEFWAEYQPWLTSFLKKHGLELKQAEGDQ
ncbi:MAG TPA: rhomboid family intramembrane serine protease [Blastocatellia bacterium]|jgi:membrane associated rhomboid family serine protease|nr:rhomboid family intramembrane serine protease [Blastocatellia bacterium]